VGFEGFGGVVEDTEEKGESAEGVECVVAGHSWSGEGRERRGESAWEQRLRYFGHWLAIHEAALVEKGKLWCRRLGGSFHLCYRSTTYWKPRRSAKRH
jgi:hypothetical protein